MSAATVGKTGQFRFPHRTRAWTFSTSSTERSLGERMREHAVVVGDAVIPRRSENQNAGAKSKTQSQWQHPLPVSRLAATKTRTAVRSTSPRSLLSRSSCLAVTAEARSAAKTKRPYHGRAVNRANSPCRMHSTKASVTMMCRSKLRRMFLPGSA